jgi:hypothetical protein
VNLSFTVYASGDFTHLTFTCGGGRGTSGDFTTPSRFTGTYGLSCHWEEAGVYAVRAALEGPTRVEDSLTFTIR